MKHKRTLISSIKIVLGKALTLSGFDDDGYYLNIVNEDEVFDEDLLLLLQTAASLLPGKDILDVGANIGYVSCVLAKLNPDKAIHAFEPVPSNVSVLANNAKQNKLKNVVIHPYGLGQKKGQSSASWDPDNRASAFITKGNEDHERYPEHETVEIKVLDDERPTLGIEDCGLIKVDIEGYELEFLRGSREFIVEHKPIVIMEANTWCLDALHRITLPDFLDELFATFPHVHGFWGNRVVDVREHTENYMHENIVGHRFMNVICSFDKEEHREILERYKKAAVHLDFTKGMPENVIADLKIEIENRKYHEQELKNTIQSQEHQMAILHQQQRNVRFLAKRLAEEIQLRLNNRASSTRNVSNNLIYGSDKSISEKIEKPWGDKEKPLEFIRKQDNQNIKRLNKNTQIGAALKSLAWKVIAKTFFLSVGASKKVAEKIMR